MSNFISAVKKFIADENGVTAIEYGLIAGLIGVMIVGGATLIGGDLNKIFSSIANTLSSAVPA
jgi:pilus assembly protein Flp/PilA